MERPWQSRYNRDEELRRSRLESINWGTARHRIPLQRQFQQLITLESFAYGRAVAKSPAGHRRSIYPVQDIMYTERYPCSSAREA